MKRLIILLISAICYSLTGYSQQLKVATYNIRYQNTNDEKQGNGWKQDSRIDHIFLSPGIQVERYGLITDFYFTADNSADSVKSANFPDEVSLIKHQARLPSDHYPVVVTIDF